MWFFLEFVPTFHSFAWHPHYLWYFICQLQTYKDKLITKKPLAFFNEPHSITCMLSIIMRKVHEKNKPTWKDKINVLRSSMNNAKNKCLFNGYCQPQVFCDKCSALFCSRATCDIWTNNEQWVLAFMLPNSNMLCAYICTLGNTKVPAHSHNESRICTPWQPHNGS